MRILVLGSCGFIGNALISFYNSRYSNNVIGVDVIEKEADGYICLKAGSNSLTSILEQYTPDVIVNAAGAANVSLSIKEPEKDYASNVIMVFDLLNSIRKACPKAKLVQLSSAALYGNPIQLPVTECEPIKPLSPYGYHKWQSEILCREFVEIYSLKVAIVRIFSAYGRGLRKQLFWDLYQKANVSNEISLFGTGEESRDFICIDDLVEAIDCVVRNGNYDANVYNVANGEEIFIKDAVTCFLQYLEWDGKLTFSGGNRPGDPLNWKADISKLSALGYRKQIPFGEGINSYCKWLKELE